MYLFSRRLAYVLGIALPVIETLRRWPQLGDPRIWPIWLDDFAIAAFLLLGANMTSRGRRENAGYLAAGWAFACGMAYPSFFNQLLHLDEPDPSSLPASWVVMIKGAGFALAIVALIGALRPPREIRGDGLIQHPERLEQMLDATDDA
jgi:hypothetical protein